MGRKPPPQPPRARARAGRTSPPRRPPRSAPRASWRAQPRARSAGPPGRRFFFVASATLRRWPASPWSPALRVRSSRAPPASCRGAGSRFAASSWVPTAGSTSREAARGAEVVVHAGVRTPRGLAEAERARREADAALAAGRAARQAGARRFVFLSTVSVYGRPRNLPCGEGEPKSPRSAFERARWAAERAAWVACREGAPLVVLRPALVYGPTLRRGAVRALALVALDARRAEAACPSCGAGPSPTSSTSRTSPGPWATWPCTRDDHDVVGRAFNVADDAPLPLAEHAAAALEAMGHRPGKVLPFSPACGPPQPGCCATCPTGSCSTPSTGASLPPGGRWRSVTVPTPASLRGSTARFSTGLPATTTMTPTA